MQPILKSEAGRKSEMIGAGMRRPHLMSSAYCLGAFVIMYCVIVSGECLAGGWTWDHQAAVNYATTITVRVQTSPPGRSFWIDGTHFTSAQPRIWTSGVSHIIRTTSPQSGGTGTQYVWRSWSNGGAMSNTVAPAVDTTYTATFTTQYNLTMSLGTGGSSVSPASGWQTNGAVVPISATAAGGYNFSRWTGSGDGSYSGSNRSASVTMNGPITETASFTAIGRSGNATRTIGGSSISILVVPPAGTSAWGAEETIPSGLTPSGIAGPNGSWSATTRTITWYATGSASATLSYTVSGAIGTYSVSGVANFDGGIVPIVGSSNIVIGGCHPADTNNDWSMEISEANLYLAGWQQGINSMSYAIRAVYLSRNGGIYSRQSGVAEPLCWVAVTPNLSVATAVKAAASPLVTTGSTRTITGGTVSIAVSPPTGTSAWAFEETVPSGLTPSGITGPNGNWNTTTRKIMWYATGAASAALGYAVTGTSGIYTETGAVNFDGADGIVSGNTQITMGTPSAAIAVQVEVTATSIRIRWASQAGLTYQVWKTTVPQGAYTQLDGLTVDGAPVGSLVASQGASTYCEVPLVSDETAAFFKIKVIDPTTP